MRNTIHKEAAMLSNRFFLVCLGVLLTVVACGSAAYAQDAPVHQQNEAVLLESSAPISWTIQKEVHGSGAAFAIIAKTKLDKFDIGLQLVLRQNEDSSLPVDYIAALHFNGTKAAVSKVYGLAVRAGAATRDFELDGLAVKVTDSYWLVGLVDQDLGSGNNLRLLEGADALAVPVLLLDGQKAVFVLQKGNEGRAVFTRVLDRWNKTMRPSSPTIPPTVEKPFQFPAEKIRKMPAAGDMDSHIMQPYR